EPDQAERPPSPARALEPSDATGQLQNLGLGFGHRRRLRGSGDHSSPSASPGPANRARSASVAGTNSKMPMHISSLVWSPQRTVFGGRLGLTGFSAELSKWATNSSRDPSGR